MKAGIPGILIPPARRPMRLGYRLLLTMQFASITPQATPRSSRWTAYASSTWSPGDRDAPSSTIRPATATYSGCSPGTASSNAGIVGAAMAATRRSQIAAAS
jgi:hypothetical protein